MSTQQPNPKAFYNAFSDNAMKDVDVHKYYVNRAADNAHDCVANMIQAIDWADQAGSYLFSGLRGAGKTTELQRLISDLHAQNIPAFYSSADNYLGLNEPDISQTELIFAALAGLCDAVKKQYGTDFLTETIWQRAQKVMNSNVELKPKLGMSGVEVEFSLQENSSFKDELVRFSQSNNQFFQEVNGFVNEVVQKIRNETGQEKIVLVVDSLERLSAPPGQERTLYNSLKDLFFNAPERLVLPDMVVIYTVPPYLHAVLPNIHQYYAESFSLPNFKVMQKPANGEDRERDQEGIQGMVEVVNKRFPEWQNYLSQAIIEHFAWLSGGNVRRMFRLIRHAALKASLNRVELPVVKVSSASIEQAIAEETKDFQWLNAEDRIWLNRCREDNGKLAEHIQNLEQDLPPIIRLFDHSLVLDYQNGSLWYQVPPIIDGHV
ncbi:MAG: hypothetical protein P8X74_21155 [Reinekea sp.]